MIYVIFIFYQLGQFLALPFFCIYLMIRKFKKKSVFGNVTERLGFVPKVLNGKKVFWFHAVSVGEILALERLINQVKDENPAAICYVTTGTVAGKKMAMQQLKADHVSFMPYDFLVPMLLAFHRIAPHVIMVMEAELWPNFLFLAYLKKIPLYGLNVRFNETSIKKKSSIRRCYGYLYSLFDHLFVQTKYDGEALVGLHVPAQKVSLLGNIKAFNVEEKRDNALVGASLDLTMHVQKACQKVLLVGSVHPGELDYYMQLFKALKPKYPGLKLILAPRHFHWKQELIEKIQRADFTFFMWDETVDLGKDQHAWWQKISQDILCDVDVLVVAVIGRLFYLYPLADLFYLGGTFVPVGGHNLLEPAVWGIPSFVGPYHKNCKDIADQLEREKGLIKVSTGQVLIEWTDYLLTHEDELEAMQWQIKKWFANEAGMVNQQLNQGFLAHLRRLSPQTKNGSQ